MQALHKAHPGATFAPGVGSGVRCTHLAFTAQTGLGPRLLACIPDSSVRVTRRVACAPLAGSRQRQN